MKKTKLSRFWEMLSIMIPALLIVVMLIPGSFVHRAHDGSLRYGSYFSNQSTLIGFVWFILMLAVLIFGFAVLGTIMRKNMVGIIFFCSFLMLCFMFLMFHILKNGQGTWLPYAPPALCAAAPVINFLAWINTDDRAAEESARWRNRWIAVFGITGAGFLQIVVSDLTDNHWNGTSLWHLCLLIMAMTAALTLIAALKTKNKTDSSGIL